MYTLNPKLRQFIIEKNNREYIISEQSTKWVVKLYNGKLCINYHISKNTCFTFGELKDYIFNNDTLF